jgi:hypothetical protein
MFKMQGEEVLYITCDYCLNERFDPLLNDEESEDEDIIWEQAEEEGWTKHTEGKAVSHACPKCSKELQ